MSENTPQHEIAKKRVVYTLPGVDAVTVRRNEEYRVTDAGAFMMDLYYPPHANRESRTPAVIFVTGCADAGARTMLGCDLKEMGSYISWAELAAASGLVAITYTNGEPATDVRAVLHHVRENAASFGIDQDRIGVWACSGHVPTALSLLMQDNQPFLKCAALLYGYTLDVDGSTAVADATKRWGFSNPCAGRSVDDLRRDVPLFVTRAGQDQMPGLNQALDRVVSKALACNLPITVVNHSAAPHAFDLFLDSESSHEIIRQILRFLQFHLLA